MQIGGKNVDGNRESRDASKGAEPMNNTVFLVLLFLLIFFLGVFTFRAVRTVVLAKHGPESNIEISMPEGCILITNGGEPILDAVLTLGTNMKAVLGTIDKGQHSVSLDAFSNIGPESGNDPMAKTVTLTGTIGGHPIHIEACFVQQRW